jgi:hypothetical protein
LLVEPDPGFEKPDFYVILVERNLIEKESV